MAFCKRCNRDVGDVRFCTNCGEDLRRLRACPECGAQAEPGFSRCPECGAQFEAATPRRGQASGLRLESIGNVRGNITDSSTVTTTNIEHMHVGLAAGSAEKTPPNVCPICGDYPELRDSFRCRGCSRDYICKRHRNEELGTCAACAGPRIEAMRQAEAARHDDEAFGAALAEGGIAALTGYRQAFPNGRHLGRLMPPPGAAPGDIWTSPADGREMAWIPAGCFRMGCDAAEGDGADEIQHDVRIERGFWMDRAEVTCEAYQRFVTANPTWQKDNIAREFHDGWYLRDWNGNDWPADRRHHPVVWVSWHAARAFAEWAGKRLPTEAEWEYACRAGSATAYWWGDHFDTTRANNSRKHTLPATDDRRRNGWRLSDMAGNVWEWSSSLYRPYPYSDDGREEALLHGPRVCRGGAWCSEESEIRSACRSARAPAGCSIMVGFRCVMQAPGG